MYQDFFNAITNLIKDWCTNFSWWSQPLPIPGMTISPLYLLSAAGISLIITIHAVRLFLTVIL